MRFADLERLLPDVGFAEVPVTTLTSRVPTALERSPLVDAVFELRFRGDNRGRAGNLLPGLFFNKLESIVSRTEDLPTQSIPKDIRDRDPGLVYAPLHALHLQDSIVRVGDRVLAVSRVMPYPGWTSFRTSLGNVLDVAQGIDLLRDVERVSFRFINLLPAHGSESIPMSTLRLEMAGNPLPESGLKLRYELRDMEHAVVIQVVPGSTVEGPGVPKRSGLLVDVDAIRLARLQSFWDEREEIIGVCHDRLKHVFFSLLTPETIVSLGPTYNEEGID